MKKTLTEQWREGTLAMGYYYVSRPTSYGGEAIKYLDDDCSFGLGEDIIQEVLAPVPSYDKLKQMIDGDKATIHHLKKILPMIEYNRVAYDYLKKVIEDMEKDIREVK